MARIDEFGNDAFKRRGALDRRSPAVVKLDPAFIEAIEHSDPWQGVVHALSAEDPFPIVTRHDFDRHRPCQHVERDRSATPGQALPARRPASRSIPREQMLRQVARHPWWRPSGMPCRPAAGSFAAASCWTTLRLPFPHVWRATAFFKVSRSAWRLSCHAANSCRSCPNGRKSSTRSMPITPRAIFRRRRSGLFWISSRKWLPDYDPRRHAKASFADSFRVEIEPGSGQERIRKRPGLGCGPGLFLSLSVPLFDGVEIDTLGLANKDNADDQGHRRDRDRVP